MQEADPTDALAVLGDETRIAILRALAEAEGVLSFTELRKAAGVDDAGRFNYHLRKLCEYFVREADGGYELGHAGSRVVAAASDGPEAATPDADDGASSPDACPVCGDEDCEKLFHVHLHTPWR